MSSKSLILSEYAWEYLLFVSQRVQERDGQKQSEAVPASVRAEPPPPHPPVRPPLGPLCWSEPLFVSFSQLRAEALATPVESHCVEAPRQPSHTKP